MILLFLPALYAIWFRIKPTKSESHENPLKAVESPKEVELLTKMAAE
jgi:hypothetical protein